MIEDRGLSVRLILGAAYGETAPATLLSETFYADVTLAPGQRFPMPDDHEDRAIYVMEGAISVAGRAFGAAQMMVFRLGDRITVAAGEQGARLMILGGATFNGPRYLWWNFVASSQERIEQAKAEWRAGRWGEGRFDLPAEDRDEHIPPAGLTRPDAFGLRRGAPCPRRPTAALRSAAATSCARARPSRPPSCGARAAPGPPIPPPSTLQTETMPWVM
tara:strand:- start:2325 stop:2978 length:654 start_codon:yes stop_codon:yes gene_type:complete